MPHLLILCTANICRSPMAEGLARQRLLEAGHTDWVVSSGGTWANNGDGASQFSLQLLDEHGMWLTNHRSRRVNGPMLAEADLVLTMTKSHKEALQVEFPEHAFKVYLISEMIGMKYDIADPFGGPIEEYRFTFEELDQLITQGLPRIVELAAGGTSA